MFSIDFGSDLTPSRSEWHFWAYMTAWRLELTEESTVVVGCEDEVNAVQACLPLIEGKRIVKYDIVNSWFDLVLSFENHMHLRTFSIEAYPDGDSWLLFTPDHKCFAAESGERWSYGSANRV